MAWTEEARAASAAARAANSGKQQAQQKKQQYQANAGNRAAFALRAKMAHDEGRGERTRAAAVNVAHQNLVHSVIPGIAKAFLGMGSGLASAMLKAAAKSRQGGRRK